MSETSADAILKLCPRIDGGQSGHDYYRQGLACWTGQGGVEEDRAKAVKLFEAAIERAEPLAHFYLGKAYTDGEGIDQDLALGLFHFIKAADQSSYEAASPEACLYIGLAFRGGLGVSPDTKLAVKYFRLACKATGAFDSGEQFRGYAEALIGDAYEFGEGVTQSYGKAEGWYRRGLKHGHNESLELLEALHAKRRDGLPVLFPFPVITVLLLVGWSALVAIDFPRLSALGREANAVIDLALALRLASIFVLRSGKTAQLKTTLRFSEAIEAKPHNVRIGGVHWVLHQGEFVRLAYDSRDRGQLYEPETGWSDRYRIELTASQLQRSLATWLPVATILVDVAGGASQAPDLAIGASALLLLVGLGALVWTYLCRHGVQWVYGAMALDPHLSGPRRDEVEHQQVHGNARLATEAEVATAAGANRRGSLDDQEL